MRGLTLAVAGGLLALPATAHHSFAMYDGSRSITLQGVVAKYQWTNPHAYLEIDAQQAGKAKRFTLEMASINMMSRWGWSSRTVRKGEQVTVTYSPLRDGRAGGALLELRLADGRRLVVGEQAKS